MQANYIRETGTDASRNHSRDFKEYKVMDSTFDGSN